MTAGSKEEQYTKLIADGYRPDELVWIEPGSAVAVELVYLAGQDPDAELRKALDRQQAGAWVIKGAAVERRIREAGGRVPATGSWIDEWLKELDGLPFKRIFGARGAR